MIRRLVGITMLMLALIVTACATTGDPNASSRRQDELSRQEILSVEAGDLYDVVRRLRPRWLNTERRTGDRSFGLQTGIVVYHHQTYLGNLETLANWSPTTVHALKWLDGSEASATLPGLGSQHVAGAIVIMTRADGT